MNQGISPIPIQNLGARSGDAGDFIDPRLVVQDFGIWEGAKIADFGAGSGHFTVLMAKLTGESGLVSAIDILESSLDTIRSKTKSEGLRNVQTIRSNLEILGSSGLPNDSQDMVLLANILFQSKKKTEIIRESRRILKNGGMLIVIDWQKGAGGLGPPDNLRLDKSAMQSIVTGEKFEFLNYINAGTFHYGLKFQKT